METNSKLIRSGLLSAVALFSWMALFAAPVAAQVIQAQVRITGMD